MDVVFICSVDDILSPRKPLRTPEQMQFGISYISSFLKAHGCRTRLIVLSRILGRKNKDIIDDCLKEFYPKLICFTAVSTEYQFIADIASYIKNLYADIYLLIGGPHVSLNPEVILSDDFDASCIGEGENPTLELVVQLKMGRWPSGIANLWIKHGPEIEHNSIRPVLEDIDSLPFPDREMWQDWIEEEQGARQPILLARGCPFECTYCCNHAFKRLAEGPYVRLRSTENILEEIKDVSAKFPANRHIYLEVETIGANKQWALELCTKLTDFNSTLKEPLSFGVNLRITPNMDWEELFTAFEKSNFEVINIGVESGSERVRSQILHRNYSNQDIIDAVWTAHRHNLKIHSYNLIGVPGETIDDFRQTVQINRLCLPDKLYPSIYFPYPGTELYHQCKRLKLLKTQPDSELERCKAVLDLPQFSKRQIQNGFIWFDYYVYKGHKPLLKILSKVLVSKFRSNSYLHYFYRRFTYSLFFKWLKRIGKKHLTPT